MKPSKMMALAVAMPIGITAGSQQTTALEMDKVKLSFSLDLQGTPRYQVSYNGKDIVLLSPVGVGLSTDSLFFTSFKIINTQKSVNADWKAMPKPLPLTILL